MTDKSNGSGSSAVPVVYVPHDDKSLIAALQHRVRQQAAQIGELRGTVTRLLGKKKKVRDGG